MGHDVRMVADLGQRPFDSRLQPGAGQRWRRAPRARVRDDPSRVGRRGWTHIGDQDIYGGETYDAYENLDAGRKLYAVTGRGGTIRRYFHRLAAGEMANNSFVTVDPSGGYLVSGEWKVRERLLVFANPRAQRNGSQVPLVGQINLDTPLENVQSCDFVDATRLVCAVDKPRQAVYSVRLSQPLTSGTTAGRVTRDFDVPKRSACGGGYEVEGIDYDVHRKVLSVGIIDPSLPAEHEGVPIRATVSRASRSGRAATNS